jgi:hypothetical protein
MSTKLDTKIKWSKMQMNEIEKKNNSNASNKDQIGYKNQMK